VGGKHRLREQIVARFPEHQTYVELFAGAAWVLFAKPPESSKCEVLNDLDGELINFWRVLKHRPAEFAEAASWLLASRELWESWRALPGVGPEVLRAVRFYAVIKLGFGAQRRPTSFGSKTTGRPTMWWADLRQEARQIVARLRRVWIEHLPWEQCHQKFDDARTFFYIDPPFRCGASKAYAHNFTDEDHARLAEVLVGKTRGRWLLSYNDDPFIAKLYRARGITTERLRVPYSLARTGRQHVRELLIRNY
jgi:DNA adenine methylase